MKTLRLTKEQFNKSKFLQKKYGKLKFVSESGRYYKTDKDVVLRLVKEAREYIDDDSIEVDSAEEFIIFDDPEIFKKIAEVQNKKGKEVQDEVKSGEVNPEEVAQQAGQAVDNVEGDGKKGGSALAATISTVGGIASSAITGAATLANNPAVLTAAAAAGYKGLLNKANEIGQEWADNHEQELETVGSWIAQWKMGTLNSTLDKREKELNAQYKAVT